jgi:hypothetical protein
MSKRARTSVDKAVVDVWQREVGQLSTRNFAHRLGASEVLSWLTLIPSFVFVFVLFCFFFFFCAFLKNGTVGLGGIRVELSNTCSGFLIIWLVFPVLDQGYAHSSLWN